MMRVMMIKVIVKAIVIHQVKKILVLIQIVKIEVRVNQKINKVQTLQVIELLINNKQ